MPYKLSSTLTLMLCVICLMFTAAAFAGTTSYVYDDLDRLHEVQFGNGDGIRYEYDKIGNLLSKTPFGNVFTITANASEGGSISPMGTLTMTADSSKTYTLTPLPGFQVAQVIVDGVALGAVSSYTFSNVTAPTHYINAYFAPLATYTITATAGPDGNVSPAGATVVTSGNNQTITITPSPGYVVSALMVDGMQLPGSIAYTFTNVTASHHINAYFTALTANSVGIATTSLADGTTGSSYSQTLAATGGVTPYTWSITSGSLPAGLSLNTTTGAITGTPTAEGSIFDLQVRDSMGTIANANLAISVGLEAGTFDGFIAGSSLRSPWLFAGYVGAGGAPITQTIATNAGHNSNPAVDIHRSGTITAGYIESYSLRSTKIRNSCSFWYKMPYVASSTVSLEWSDGTTTWVEDAEAYVLNYFNGNLIADGTWRQFTLPTYSTYLEIHRQYSQALVEVDSHDYFDSFVEDYVTITAAAGANGSISPAGAITVPAGNNQIYTVTPNPGFAVSALFVDGMQLPGAMSYTFTNLAADHTISVSFIANPVSVTLTPSLVSPQLQGTAVTFTASGAGGTGSYEYQFWLNSGTGWTLVRDYTTTNTWTWETTGLTIGAYAIQANVRNAGSMVLPYEAAKIVDFVINPTAAISATLTSTPASLQGAGPTVTYHGGGVGGTGSYEYQFWLNNGAGWTMVREYNTSNDWNWDTTGLAVGAYVVQVNVRSVGSSVLPYEAAKLMDFTINPPAATGATLTATVTESTVSYQGGGVGGTGSYEYQFWLNNGAGWTMVRDYTTGNAWDWNTTGLAVGTYSVQVNVRSAGSSVLPYEAAKILNYVLQ